jgi:hypothetical protein
MSLFKAELLFGHGIYWSPTVNHSALVSDCTKMHATYDWLFTGGKGQLFSVPGRLWLLYT